MKKYVIFIFAILTLFYTVVCEIVSMDPCPEPVNTCSVTEIRISPCPQATTTKRCELQRGKNASIQIDFTADEDVSAVTGKLYWASFVDLPFVGMESNACSLTTCPIAKGNHQTYNLNLLVGKKLPRGNYDVKWKIFREDDSLLCCKQFKIKLLR